jgi:RimJ/RimL family protein N-acetyltransferase
LRGIVKTDLPTLYEYEHDPEATAMAAFSAREWERFQTHWERVWNNPKAVARAIMWEGQVAGNIGAWEQDGKWLVGYWIGREFWGKGVATAALRAMLEEVTERPIWAHVVAHNKGSQRVLEKCGFVVAGQEMGEDGVVEVLYRLDL